ncbi:MAG: ABC transporter substrate-binding protein [Pirellulaceae bacterium]|nr:ABC transporter substrate-binding protein [Planctomycetales bacterium]
MQSVSVRDPVVGNERGRSSDSMLFVTLMFVIGALVAVVLSLRGTTPDLRVGVNPWPGYAFLFVAEEKGYFADEHLQVRLVELSSLGDVRRAFELQQINMMTCTYVELLMVGQAHGTPPRIVLCADYSLGADVLISNSSIRSVEELRGRRIAFEPGTLDAIVICYALQSHGMTTSDVKLVAMASSQMAHALRDGHIDAVQCYPPLSTEILSDPGSRVLFDSSQIPGKVCDVIVAHSDLGRDHPAALEAFSRAYFRAVEYYRQQPDEALEIIARRTGMTAAQVQDSLDCIRILDARDQCQLLGNPEQLETTLAETERHMRAVGLWRGEHAAKATESKAPQPVGN